MVKCEVCKGKKRDWNDPRKPCKACGGTGRATDWDKVKPKGKGKGKGDKK